MSSEALGKKRSRGRPKLPNGTAKDCVIVLRLTDKEREEFEESAKEAKMPFADWARQAMSKKTKAAPKQADPPSVLRLSEEGATIYLEASTPLPRCLWNRLSRYVRDVLAPIEARRLVDAAESEDGE